MKKVFFSLAIILGGLLSTTACSSNDDNKYEQTTIPQSDSSLQLVKIVNTGNYGSNEVYEKVVEEQIAKGERTASAIEVKNDTLNVYTAKWLTQPTDSFTVSYWTYNGRLGISLTPYYDANKVYSQVMTLCTCKLQFVGDLSKTYTLE